MKNAHRGVPRVEYQCRRRERRCIPLFRLSSASWTSSSIPQLSLSLSHPLAQLLLPPFHHGQSFSSSRRRPNPRAPLHGFQIHCARSFFTFLASSPTPPITSTNHHLAGKQGFSGRRSSFAPEIHLAVELSSPATILTAQQLKSIVSDLVMLMLPSFFDVHMVSALVPEPRHLSAPPPCRWPCQASFPRAQHPGLSVRHHVDCNGAPRHQSPRRRQEWHAAPSAVVTGWARLLRLV